MTAQPYFASTDPGQDDPFGPGGRADRARWCVWHAASGTLRGVVLHVHAFAEEMNKSRRMAGLQARSLAQAGFGVLQLDLLGCGDSAGDFGDATWARWIADVAWGTQHVIRRATAAHGTSAADVPLWLWGHRLGALLAVEAADAATRVAGKAPHLLFWQPLVSGKTALQSFLRLKAAAEMLDGGSKGVTEMLKRELAEGRPVEVAGYRLHPELASGMSAASLAPPAEPGRAVWLEVAPDPAVGLSPAVRLALDRWQSAGWQVETACVGGPPFWQTTEIEDAPALVSHSTRALTS